MRADYPNTVEGLLRDLKGIGRYTAGAIASIAFGLEEPLVDGNVIRVFTRLIGIRKESTSKSVIDELWLIAGEFVIGPTPRRSQSSDHGAGRDNLFAQETRLPAVPLTLHL